MNDSNTEHSEPLEHGNQPSPGRESGKVLSSWWDFTLWPIVGLTLLSAFFFAIGFMQRGGWLVEDEAQVDRHQQSQARYICPMMCVAPTAQPGRCPVCDMELVEAATGPAFIDPATRRILNIQTAAVVEREVTRSIRSVGELSFDESKLRTLSAYVDGRVEELYANYTGVQVNQGVRLALIYSPRLYQSQVELLLARRSERDRRGADAADAILGDSYRSAHRRLIELGMTSDQIESLELAGQANSRLHLVAPISGTVIEKLAVEGQYIKEGEPIYRLADLSTVWLVLRLFPEDAALVSVGQGVTAEVQSLPGRTFEGQVEFVFPQVDPVTRTVAVRVAIPNQQGMLRVGDYARATIDVPLTAADQPLGPVLVVPRDAVLMAGDHSVVYVEIEPGRFDLRRVKMGPISGREVVIVEGLHKGEQVATRGNFLIDSQMQLAGNPSLIDPSRAAESSAADEWPPHVLAALESLSSDDRELVSRQRL
ncbi:MAG TPA: efflux RND transporter periplasmic adaptor subunit [Pirellulaceae bacterium]|nr:efflux RND transporter periplasmic adaptor subunit [Pirellulaceae bacterium]